MSVGAVRSLTLSLTLIAVLYQVSGTPRYQEMMHTRVFARAPDKGRQTIAICYQDTTASTVFVQVQHF